MTKSFHPEAAARNGLMAALLAEAGFDSSNRAIEAPRGWARVISDHCDMGEILDTLGTEWETSLNSYKPFACGIVVHTTIDGCQQIHRKLGDVKIDPISRVQLRTAPLVLELTGKNAPTTGLEGKFSVYHASACALLRGDGSPGAFADEDVNDVELIELRNLVEVTAVTSMHEALAKVEVTFASGRRVRKRVERAIGSHQRPLTDKELEWKFLDQTGKSMGETASRRLLDHAWRIDGHEIRPSRIAKLSALP